jgi:predicted acylesterase/phospholipase RssA
MNSKTIGLCLSGGGHRASLFSLGALLYLIDAGRNQDVRVISSVSGGSLTNAFLATQSFSFSSPWEPAQFDACAAQFAESIAGKPRVWAIALTVHVILLLFWLSQLPSLLAFRSGWWHAQAMYLLAVLVFACTISWRSGGSFWGYWCTWAYVSVLFPAGVLLVAIWFSVLPWWGCIVVMAVAFGIFRYLNIVADHAFRRMILRHGAKERQRLEGIHSQPRHVFCATDMHTGKHAFFSKDLLYAPQLGVGVPHKLALSTAVQVSANFPVGFPHRWLHTDPYDFYLFAPDRQCTWKVVLSDGGVYDNLGLAWFTEAASRTFDLRQRLDLIESLNEHLGTHSPVEQVKQRVVAQISAMESQTDMLICVNSSPPHITRKVRFSRVPVLSMLASLVDVQSVMYNTLGVAVSRLLRKRFLSERSTGAMVSIEDNPDTMTGLAAGKPDVFTGLKYYLDIPTHLLEPYRDTAMRILERARFGPTHESETAEVHRQTQELQKRINALKAESASQSGTPMDRGRVDKEIARIKQIAKLQSEQAQIEKAYRQHREEKHSQNMNRMNSLNSLADLSRSTATTFRPLGKKASAALLEHGYLTCMANCHLLLGFPRFDDPPDSSDFARLVAGCPRERHPGSWSTVSEPERKLTDAASGSSAA